MAYPLTNLSLPFGTPRLPGEALGVRSLERINLYLHLSYCNHQSFVWRQYTTYPFRLSQSLPLDPSDGNRVYLYIMNASPGLLAGDNLHAVVNLDANTNLYLTDQSANKVHSLPVLGTPAQVAYEINVGAKAYLEFVPEPLILYAHSALEQKMQITLHPASRLFLSEIILPGRLARKEFYRFRYYSSLLQVHDPTGKLLFADAMRLEGEANAWKDSSFFAAFPAIANLIIVLPDVEKMSHALANFVAESQQIRTGTSLLPHGNGLLVRAMADNASTLKTYIRYALNCVRHLSGQSKLPEIPK